MKKIELTQGKVTIVDDEDYEELSQYTWYAYKGGVEGTFYAARWESPSSIAMHGHILKCRSGIDHINGDGLDNRRSNLRKATASQNGMNRRKQQIPTHSKFKGVSWHTRDKKWRAMIQKDKKPRYLGSFDSELEAAEAYNKAAIELFGEFANLNDLRLWEEA